MAQSLNGIECQFVLNYFFESTCIVQSQTIRQSSPTFGKQIAADRGSASSQSAPKMPLPVLLQSSPKRSVMPQ